MALPKKTARWVLKGTNGLSSLVYEPEADIPTMGDGEVLVELKAASLNYREIVVAKGGSGPVTEGIIPGSDGSGTVLAIGSSIKNFKVGDKVITHLAPFTTDSELPSYSERIMTGLGQQVNGTLCQYGVFPESGLVKTPKGISFEEACTLTCSALTAWNALMGLEGREVKEGDWVLVQGSGGVSVAALQFAVAMGANVIATTSSDEKGRRLKELGAKHIINYRSTPEWSDIAKKLTPDGRGLNLVVDVGGDNTLGQSTKSVRPNGLVVAAGLVAGPAGSERPPLLSVLWDICVVRGVILGSREMFYAMNKFVEEKGVKLALDDEVFQLKDAVKAYEKLEAQKHFSKIIIRI